MIFYHSRPTLLTTLAAEGVLDSIFSIKSFGNFDRMSKIFKAISDFRIDLILLGVKRFSRMPLGF